MLQDSRHQRSVMERDFATSDSFQWCIASRAAFFSASENIGGGRLRSHFVPSSNIAAVVGNRRRSRGRQKEKEIVGQFSRRQEEENGAV